MNKFPQNKSYILIINNNQNKKLNSKLINKNSKNVERQK